VGRRLWIALLIFAAAAVPAAAQQARFSLHLDALPLTSKDPRTQARLAQWNSPIGRLQYQMAEMRANAGRTGLVGGAPAALVFRLKAQGALPLHLVTAITAGGVQLHEQTLAVIHWPWEKEKGPKHKVLSVDEQISTLLGSRLHPK